MAKTREIKRRIKAVGNIKRITKTMQMIATARYQAAVRTVMAAQPYARKIAELVGELAASVASEGEGVSHPLLRTPTGEGKKLLLVLTSNRGLCGGYNASIMRLAYHEFIRKQEPGKLDVEMVGKKGIAYCRFVGIPLAAAHSQFGDKPSYAEVEKLAESYMQRFISGEYDAVYVAHMAFISAAKQVPRLLPLLPLQNPVKEEAKGQAPHRQSAQYDFSPDPKELLEQLLPETVKTQLFQCFNEASAGEHVARMVAMKNATDAATKMGKLLTRRYNRARQTAITTELSEIIGGAAALQ